MLHARRWRGHCTHEVVEGAEHARAATLFVHAHLLQLGVRQIDGHLQIDLVRMEERDQLREVPPAPVQAAIKGG